MMGHHRYRQPVVPPRPERGGAHETRGVCAQQVKTLLGPEGYTQYQDYTRNLGSYHTGVTNFVFLDGSVHGISSNIDATTFRALGTPTGADVKIANHDGATPLFLAAESGSAPSWYA